RLRRLHTHFSFKFWSVFNGRWTRRPPVGAYFLSFRNLRQYPGYDFSVTFRSLLAKPEFREACESGKLPPLLGGGVMSVSAQFSRKVCFSEFELNLATAELRSNGNKAILPGQPFQVLVALLNRPGELVTREELKRRLWTTDTFVDFDHSLNKAV